MTGSPGLRTFAKSFPGQTRSAPRSNKSKISKAFQKLPHSSVRFVSFENKLGSMCLSSFVFGNALLRTKNDERFQTVSASYRMRTCHLPASEHLRTHPLRASDREGVRSRPVPASENH